MYRIVKNKLLRGWFVVKGNHDFPIYGPFDTKGEAQLWVKARNK